MKRLLENNFKIDQKDDQFWTLNAFHDIFKLMFCQSKVIN